MTNMSHLRFFYAIFLKLFKTCLSENDDNLPSDHSTNTLSISSMYMFVAVLVYRLNLPEAHARQGVSRRR